jgi:hypothetical protein
MRHEIQYLDWNQIIGIVAGSNGKYHGARKFSGRSDIAKPHVPPICTHYNI